MDINSLKRDPQSVKSALKVVGNTLYAAKDIKIHSPLRFFERGMGEIGSNIYILAIFPFIVEESIFSVLIVDAMMQIEPNQYRVVNIEDTDYYEFEFRAGSVICPNLDLVKKDTLVYNIYDEIISKGRIPWYLDYLELGAIFDTAALHAGTNIGENREVTELLISLIARDKTDRTKYYRQSIKSLADLEKTSPEYVSMRSVIYSATNTLNKIAGSYMESGVVSALVSPSDRTEHIENLLRV